MVLCVDKSLSKIENWLSLNDIGKSKKRREIAKAMFWLVYENKISLEDIDDIVSHINENHFVFKEGNVWNDIRIYFNKNEKYLKFFKELSKITPTGLNTSPNACCGKYELMYRLLRPKCKQPKKGDILDDGKIIEIKGEQVRLLGNTSGKMYESITRKIFSGKIKGNVPHTGGLKGKEVFEIEKYERRYEKEFQKLDVEDMKTCFNELLKELKVEGDIDAHVSRICKDDKFNQNEYKRVLLEDMFASYKKSSEFTKLILFGDGTNVKMIETKDDLERISIYSDYFRINQEAKIGWYIR